MKNIKKFFYAICIMCFIAILFADAVQVEATSNINWTKWTTTCGQTKTIKVAGSKNGKAKYQGKYYPIKYLSSNKKAVKVDKKGKVTAVKAGSANIDVYIRVGMVHQTLGTCKVKVSHAYETTNTEEKEATLYQDGGTYVTSVCKGCKDEKVTIKNQEPFYYTEEFVEEEIERIVNISQNECPFSFDTSSRFLKWLVDNEYVAESVLEASKNTKGTFPGNYDNKGNRGLCEDGAHSLQSCLMGTKDRQYVLVHDSGDKTDGFNFQTDLKSGDIIRTRRHTTCFKSYVRFSDGTVYMQCYTGSNGELVYEEEQVLSPEDIGISTLIGAAVFRLPNYK